MLWIIIGIVAALTVVCLLWLTAGHVVAGRKGPTMGRETMEGRRAEAKSDLNPKGYVMFDGEYWMAECDEPVKEGTEVVIRKIEGPKLKVSKAKDQ